MKKVILNTIILITICICLLLISSFVSFLVVTTRGASLSKSALGSNELIQTTIKEIKGKPKEEKITEERINILVVGTSEGQNDVTIVASLSKTNGTLNLIFIPRDTYYQATGGNSRNIDKIGEIYSSLKIDGLRVAVEELLPTLEIHHYVTVDHRGFVDIINSLGGVPITISQTMSYEDSYQKPSLTISFSPGTYTLKGEDSLKYIRYLNGSRRGSLQRGDDLGRTEAIKGFLLNAIDKTLSGKLPVVINTAYRHVENDLNMSDLTKIASAALKLTKDSIHTYTLPGVMTVEEYYVIDAEAVKNMMEEINLIEAANLN